MKLEKIQSSIGKGMASLASVMKVILLSGQAFPSSEEGEGRSVVIMGNGPSLRQTIDENFDRLCSHELMAVNFAANTPDFQRLRPRYYILADGHFFNGAGRDPNVRKIWETLSAVTWDITLFVPVKFRHFAKAFLLNAGNVTLKTFNLTPVEGWSGVRNFLIDRGMGMPRPRNVMVPAILCAIRMGYKKIYLCGADHTWTKTLDVDDENFVVTVQPHFYEDNPAEKERVRETYKGIRLHEVLGSMATAFRSYCEIADYAKSRGIEIVNATPGSMIDAFKRKNL